MESEMVWVGRDLKYHLVPTPCRVWVTLVSGGGWSTFIRRDDAHCAFGLSSASTKSLLWACQIGCPATDTGLCSTRNFRLQRLIEIQKHWRRSRLDNERSDKLLGNKEKMLRTSQEITVVYPIEIKNVLFHSCVIWKFASLSPENLNFKSY